MDENWTLLDFNGNQSHAIPDNKITLSIDERNTRRITLNAEMTAKIREEGFCYLEVYLNNFSPEAQFVFRKKQTPKSLTIQPGKKSRTTINSKFLVGKLVEKMGLELKTQHLTVSENVSNSPEYATYRITK